MNYFTDEQVREIIINNLGALNLINGTFEFTELQIKSLMNLAVTTAIGNELGTFVGDFNGDVNDNLFFSVKANSLPKLGAKIYTVKEIS